MKSKEISWLNTFLKYSDEELQKPNYVNGIFSLLQLHQLMKTRVENNDMLFPRDIYILCLSIHAKESLDKGWTIKQTTKGLCTLIKRYGLNCDRILTDIVCNREKYSDSVYQVILDHAYELHKISEDRREENRLIHEIKNEDLTSEENIEKNHIPKQNDYTVVIGTKILH